MNKSRNKKSAVDLARMGETRNATETLDEKCEGKKDCWETYEENMKMDL